MNTLELFCGTKSFSKIAKALGHSTLTLDNEHKFNPDLIIETIKPKHFFIENPRAMLRKLPYLQNLRKVTVTYCQYGDTRMKPTDIWTNIPESIWTPRPICKNGSSCHVAAPRGSRNGTQGLKSKIERGVIPPDLFFEIFKAIKEAEKI